MNEPIWLQKAVLLPIHDALIKNHGGSYGIRDENLLNSALGRPQNIFAYDQGDIFDMAAAYAYGIAKNHAFIDGNKRSAFSASGIFLNLNNYKLKANKAEAVHMIVSLANGEIDEKLYAVWLRENSQEK